MSTTRCERARELIPDFVTGRLDGSEVTLVEAHLPRCPECSAEAALVRMLLATRPDPRPGLVERVRDAVSADRGAARRPAWALLAASVAALALGIGVVSSTGGETDPEAAVPAYASETGGEGLWMTDDGLVAGGPVWDELSDDALTQLLEELSTGGPA